MKKLIELDAAIDVVDKRIRQIGYEDNALVLSIRQAVRDIEPVDAVPVRRGRWLWRNYPGYQYQCDQCKRWAMYESKFCPECGALMEWWKEGDGNG